jgi:hypothetical protein
MSLWQKRKYSKNKWSKNRCIWTSSMLWWFYRQLIIGEEYSTKSGPLRGYLLPNLLENYCANIAQHVANVSLDLLVINRMVCDFKVKLK